MKTELLALVSPGDGPCPDGCRRVAGPGYDAVLEPAASAMRKLGRRRMLTRARDRALRMEALLPAGGVILPALPGQAVAAKDVDGLVRANRPDLDALAARARGCVQFQVSVTWDEALARARFGDLDAARHRLSAAAEAPLSAVAAEVLGLPVAADGLINRAVLVPRSSIPALDDAVEAIDALWTEGLRIRQIGPMPPVSFCSLVVRRVPARAVAAARLALGIDGHADPALIDAARRARLRAGAAPDVIRTTAGIAAAAARRGPPEGDLLLCDIWSEDRAETVRSRPPGEAA